MSSANTPQSEQGWRVTGMRFDPDRGVYDAGRAAALSGVPVTTLHYWARSGIYYPSIAPDPRERLWSWNDLVNIRFIDWLRKDKAPPQPRRTDTAYVHEVLNAIRQQGYDQEQFYWLVTVDQAGRLFLGDGEVSAVALPGSQQAMGRVLDLVQPYEAAPHLLNPRPLLRIIPGKLHGEPHLVRTRIPSATVYGLHLQGYSVPEIRSMYPDAAPAAIKQAIEFEASLVRSTPAA